MTPQASRFLEKAERLLAHANTMLDVDLNEDAGRSLPCGIYRRQTYNLKAIADCDTGPDAEISAARAAEAVAMGKQFVAHITELIRSPNTGPAADSTPKA